VHFLEVKKYLPGADVTPLRAFKFSSGQNRTQKSKSLGLIISKTCFTHYLKNAATIYRTYMIAAFFISIFLPYIWLNTNFSL